MNVATLEPRNWSRRRWWTLIALVFAAHLGLIFAFSDRKLVTPRSIVHAPTLWFAVTSNERVALNDPTLFAPVPDVMITNSFRVLLALNDPTLFALPHREDFAGSVWARTHDVGFQPFRWTETNRLFALAAEKLGLIFTQFMKTNAPVPFELEVKPAPRLALPIAPAVGPAPPARSTLRIEGGLAKRRLLNLPELKSWPATGLLTNSVVQVLVNEDGNVFSSTLLAKSGLPEADQSAVETAKAARFAPLRGGGDKLNLGTMVFQWYTVPKAGTNAPRSGP